MADYQSVLLAGAFSTPKLEPDSSTQVLLYRQHTYPFLFSEVYWCVQSDIRSELESFNRLVCLRFL